MKNIKSRDIKRKFAKKIKTIESETKKIQSKNNPIQIAMKKKLMIEQIEEKSGLYNK